MIEVSGYIKDLLARQNAKEYLTGINDKEEFILSMIDAPILFNGKPIGVVNSVDDEFWTGVIWRDSAIEVNPIYKSISAITLI